jgi:hypothetical protein
MSTKSRLTRREFLKSSTQTGVGLAAVGKVRLLGHSAPSEAKPTAAQVPPVPAQAPKGNWPQDYTVRRDDAAGELILSTPYYSVVHDLRAGGVIRRISYTHGQAPNLLLNPLAASVQPAAPKLPEHVTKEENARLPAPQSDVHDPTPEVSVSKAGRWPVVTVEAALRATDGASAGIRTRTAYEYRWGYIKIHKEFQFPAVAVRTSAVTVLSATWHPSLTHYGRRPGAFDNARVSPFSIEPLQCEVMRPGSNLNGPLDTRFVPCYMVFVNPGIEGIEWFAADDLSQWFYQIAGQPGTGHVSVKARTEPVGIDFTLSPLELPTYPDLERGGFVELSGSYAFDYYLGLSILEGHAHRPWLEVSFGPHRGQWVSDDEIRRHAEGGLATMTLHNDGDAFGDGLFWRDGTFPPYPPAEMAKMEHVIGTCHQNGIRVMPYFSNHELHQSTQAFKEHGEEWGRKPDDQGNLRPQYYYGSHMCFKSGWKDFFQSYVDTVLKHQPWDGVYYDWNMPLYCNNPLHMGKTSNEVSGEKGLATYAFSRTSHWDVDEFLEMIEWTRERVGPQGLVTLHNTGTPMLAAENFADAICCLEWGYGKIIDGMPKPEDLPLEWSFAGARARSDIEYGTIDTKAPRRIHTLYYLTTLITGTAPWPASPESERLFQVLKPLGDIEQYHFEDWRNRAVKVNLPDVLSAVYSRPGEAYILLANLQPAPRRVDCSINPHALKYPLRSVQSAEVVGDVKLDAGRLMAEGEPISLPTDSIKLLHLRG